MPRGGRRPGAGAPMRNLNGLRSGHRSHALKAFVLVNLLVPELRPVFLRLNSMSPDERAVLDDAVRAYGALADSRLQRRSINAMRRHLSEETNKFFRAIKPILEQHGLPADNIEAAFPDHYSQDQGFDPAPYPAWLETEGSDTGEADPLAAQLGPIRERWAP